MTATEHTKVSKTRQRGLRSPGISFRMPFKRIGAFSVAAGLVLFAGVARPENPTATLPAAPAAPQIVEQMLRHNRAQAEQLKHYQELRHYQVQYKGFSADLVGKMDVSVTFDAASGKSFHIVSQSGSKLLCDKVLKKAVDSESEASKDQSATALTPANYKFELAGTEIVDGRPAYVLTVAPVANSKFLYRGKVWVDAADFAVIRIKAEPAKNPSFWIQRPQITFTSKKTGDFWLPTSNRSETKVRVGGTAVFTIDYGTYLIDAVASQATATR
jgi:hypothetical protein